MMRIGQTSGMSDPGRTYVTCEATACTSGEVAVGTRTINDRSQPEAAIQKLRPSAQVAGRMDIEITHQPRSAGPRCGEPNERNCHFIVKVWLYSLREVPPVANRRAAPRPGDARRPAALFPRMSGTGSCVDGAGVTFAYLKICCPIVARSLP